MGIFSWLAKRTVKQEPSPRLARQGRVLPALRLDNQFTRIGGQQTPQTVSSILQEADTGYIYRYTDLLNETRQKDAHLQSLLGTREAALTGLRWIVNPASKDAIDEERAQFVKQAFKKANGRGKQSRGFIDMISHLSGGVYHGHATSETEWDLAKFEGRTTIQPVGFVNHSQRRFRFSQTTGELGWRDETGRITEEPIDLQARWPGKFLQHQPRINGDVPSREGLGRLLVWPGLFRNWTLSDFMRLAELAWKPWRMGKYNQDANQEEIDGLVTALDTLTTSGVGLFSQRAEIEVAWPERGRGGKPEHESLLEWLGSEMSKAVLGQTLTVESGERGARSLGEVHDRVRKDIRELDAIGMMVTVNRDLVAPLLSLNYSDDRPPPVWILVTDDTIDIGNFARAMDALVRAGLKMPQEWARDKVGCPEPDAGDEIMMGRTFMEAEAGMMSTNVQEWQGEVVGEVESDDDDDSDDPEADPEDAPDPDDG